MTISTYLSAMLTADEYSRIHGMTSPVFLDDADRLLLTHYRDWFTVLRATGLMAELDYVEPMSTPMQRHSRIANRRRIGGAIHGGTALLLSSRLASGDDAR